MKLFLCVFLLIGSPYFVYLYDEPSEHTSEVRIGENNEFVIGSTILGMGSFGVVRMGLNTLTGEKVAVKVELTDTSYPTLKNEKKSYDIIGPQNGIPKIYYFGQMNNGKYNVLVMQYLTKSLDKLLESQNDKFSEKTTYMIGIQLMYRIELIHRKRLLHRDIKPHNMGIFSGKVIYLYDFGLSRSYIHDKKHVKEQPATSSGEGTPTYMSAYAHIHRVQSRRDDLESIGFMLMSFLKGKLPWDSINASDYDQLSSQYNKIKQNLDFEKFCAGYPKEILQYFQYVRNLSFQQKPDYKYLRSLFKGALKSIGAEEDYEFDWLA